MRYAKALGAGVLLALAALIAWLVLKIALSSLYWRLVVAPPTNGSGGVGSVSVLVTTWELLIVGVAGFSAGVWRVLRRRHA